MLLKDLKEKPLLLDMKVKKHFSTEIPLYMLGALAVANSYDYLQVVMK